MGQWRGGAQIVPIEQLTGPGWSTGHTLVVGFGNELRGDDGVGQVVAEALWSQRHDVPALAGATLHLVRRSWCPRWRSTCPRSGFAVFVDAAYDGGPPGLVHLSQLDNEVKPKAGGRVAGAVGCWVDLSPATLVSLSAELFGAAPPTALVTVSVEVPAIGVGLSPPVRAAVPVAVRVVEDAIASRRPSVGPWRI